MEIQGYTDILFKFTDFVSDIKSQYFFVLIVFLLFKISNLFVLPDSFWLNKDYTKSQHIKVFSYCSDQEFLLE